MIYLNSHIVRGKVHVTKYHSRMSNLISLISKGRSENINNATNKLNAILAACLNKKIPIYFCTM